MRRKKDARYYQKGFTLIEILIVVVIIGFLTATISPELFNRV
ncbi:MAG TPA: type II secretion system protein GspG, partial [Firmicutes bacterium]|nr:type II secretion system protein GspG [Bacillota bacterium]